jgi:hypothetical protein
MPVRNISRSSLVGAGLRGFGILCRCFDDLVLCVEALFCQLIECPPTRAIGRNRIGGNPFRVDESIEIGARADRGVQFARLDPADRIGIGCAGDAGEGQRECQWFDAKIS